MSQSETQVSPYHFLPVIYQCITPLHIGCGQDVGIVDLPVIRERTTGYPFIPGSGIRGSLRDHCGHKKREKASVAAGEAGGSSPQEAATTPDLLRLFGSEPGDTLTAGCISIVDARILLFPVRSAPGPFRWITCPFVLEQYRRDRNYFLGDRVPPIRKPDSPPGEGQYCGSGANESLYLEEFPYDRLGAWEPSIGIEGVDSNRVVLIGDEDFSYFVQYATIVTQRNHLSSVKTVLKGQLFSVESVPSEAIFYGFFGSTQERAPVGKDRWSKKEAMESLLGLISDLPEKGNVETGSTASDNSGGVDSTIGKCHLVLGGDESTGLGLTRISWKQQVQSAKES